MVSVCDDLEQAGHVRRERPARPALPRRHHHRRGQAAAGRGAGVGYRVPRRHLQGPHPRRARSARHSAGQAPGHRRRPAPTSRTRAQQADPADGMVSGRAESDADPMK
ncbi:hypothetical protein [Nonomuraea roseola]|uniref:Uncharacterized protein n=1 Tax=Nonomuraea roseola TaxID=46179 RepID=A0ABV5QEK0_9ACTN